MKNLKALALVALASTALVGCGEAKPFETNFTEVVMADFSTNHGTAEVSDRQIKFVFDDKEMGDVIATYNNCVTVSDTVMNCSEQLTFDDGETTDIGKAIIKNEDGHLQINSTKDELLTSVFDAGHKFTF